MTSRLKELVPEQLYEECSDDEIVYAVFSCIQHRNGTREDALVMCVKELVKNRRFLMEMLKKSLLLQPPPVIIYKDKELND